MRLRVESWARTGVPSVVHCGCLLCSGPRAGPRPPAVPWPAQVAPGAQSETTILGVEAGRRLQDCSAVSPSVAPLGGET